MIVTAVVIAILAVSLMLFMQLPVFGKHTTGEDLARIEKSTNYKDGSFQNVQPTEVMLKEVSTLRVMREMLNKPSTVEPSKPLPTVKTDLKNLASDKLTIVWFGHSSYLIKYKDFTVLVDPVMSGYASPIGIFGKAFEGTDVFSVDDLPLIDLLVITHDHYDHLDYATLIKLHTSVKNIITPLGVDAHLKHWGVPAEKIKSLDWWETHKLNDSTIITSTPSRHFSGRGFTRGKTLWSSFVLNLQGHNIFIGGDSGYDNQFKKIGDLYGPFEIAMLETGQYGKNWPFIHMMPEEVANAAQDLQANVLLPVHWAKFALSNHAWTEPIERLIASGEGKVVMTTPKIGEPVRLGDTLPVEKWWREVDVLIR
ncbi:MBL fold metallo-hydrolase [Chryseotalea sanaruensis]|uniref:MBL fold metallo-hydrolase n=2 Tax=Chryseotalea sanaruensis TaxID=2482724 RepID=A0A401U7H2_9BACT|nr:MBL fold metallo-hydrolase [Chryseotalea sanaruensis]